jgi:hypothetical protein
MESSRVPQKKILDDRPEGRPRLTWLHDVMNDLRNAGRVRHWRKKAEHRRELAGIVRGAKVKFKTTV